MAFTNILDASVGGTVEVSEVESLADGTIIVGDGSGAPTTLAALTSATGTLKHEYGGVEANISAIADGGIVVGTGAGTMAVRASALTAGAAGYVKHELGGIEADISAVVDGDVIVGTGAGTMGLESGATLRTTLGLGTGDSPQLTGIELGHATDTTITRASAGNIAIEGNAVYRAGGTDVPLADGGTGASLADPGADRFLFWDDSETLAAWLTAGNGLTITATTVDVDTASATVDGISELATVAELETGTDTGRTITPDVLAGSNFGERAIVIQAVGGTTDNATGDGKAYFTIPSSMAGMDLVEVHARVVTAGTTGTQDIQINNVTQAADMLTTKITIDSAETGSDTAAAAAVIDAANDDVAANDLLRIDVDAVHTTAAKGLIVTLIFRLP